tara:strand:+ start:368 stop:811 length:444 start_codon:yes stop_codon:yes gene_type:complete
MEENMKDTYDAWLIDPFEETVTMIKIPSDVKKWKEILQIDSPIDMVSWGTAHTIIIDDEGLLRDENRYFKVEEYPQALAGRGLIVDVDQDSGEITDTTYNGKLAFLPEGYKVEPIVTVTNFEDYDELKQKLSFEQELEKEFSPKELH